VHRKVVYRRWTAPRQAAEYRH